MAAANAALSSPCSLQSSPSSHTSLSLPRHFTHNATARVYKAQSCCKAPAATARVPSSFWAVKQWSIGTLSRARRVVASAAAGDELANGSSSGAHRSLSKTRRDMLLEYVQNVQPEFMELFVKKAPQQVVEAMRHTVTNMLGTLPPQFFEITVTTVAENLAQLMYSVLMTGYMFRNAQYRLELQQSLEQAALPSPSKDRFGADYEDCVQKSHVSGEVLKWHKQDGAVPMDAVEYIELLESEIDKLQQQLERKASHNRNELLEYLKNLEPKNLQELTTSAGEDAVEAMNTFVQRLIGIADPGLLKKAATETSAKELARLLYWLMVVGYSIRNIEVRYDMERILGMPAKIAELPPGEAA